MKSTRCASVCINKVTTNLQVWEVYLGQRRILSIVARHIEEVLRILYCSDGYLLQVREDRRIAIYSLVADISAIIILYLRHGIGGIG